jgi:D-sedoheptulose 7-phosphate isomerase
MNLIDCIKTSFDESIKVKKMALEDLSQKILTTSEALVRCISNEHKILCCGNGGSACDSQHFVAELINRFQIERDGFPAIALTADIAVLTAISNDYGFQKVFSKQVKALGKEGDILFAISTSGKSQNVILAIQEAHKNKMQVIALTGDNGITTNILNDTDIELRVPSSTTARTQESHILIIHCLCDLIDKQLFGTSGEKT